LDLAASNSERTVKTVPQNALETFGLRMLWPCNMGLGKPMEPARIGCQGACMRTTYLSTLLLAFCAIGPCNASTMASGAPSTALKT
jgi:hypothetical protein